MMSGTYNYSTPSTKTNLTTQPSTSSSSNNNQSSNECQTFPKMLEDIHKHWLKKMKEYNTVKDDIEHTERMFNLYESNPIFFQTKEALLIQQEKIKVQIQQLEEQVYIIKSNFVSY